MPKKKLQLAVIGCGAIFQNNHLPVLKNSDEWQIAFLVDNDNKRIKQFAGKLECGFSQKIEDIPQTIDACLIATPNFLHAQQSIDMLERGYHVICEKPMAIHLAEAENVLTSAKKNKKHFFVVHQKRFQQNVIYLKKYLLNANEVSKVDLSLGNKFGWISRTNFYTSAEKAGGGAFIDLGVHLLDLLVSLWNNIEIDEIVFSESIRSNPVMDSAATCFGTIEGSIPFTLRVSRVAQLNNTCRIKLTNQEIEFSLEDPNSISIDKTGSSNFKKINFEIACYQDPFQSYWQNIASVILGNNTITKPPMIEDGIKVMKCIEKFKNMCLLKANKIQS